MKILIIDNGSSYINSLARLVSPHNVTIKSYDQISTADTTTNDLVILSGGHKFSVIGHEQIFSKEIEIIQNSAVPILGICLGFELIAHAYGAQMAKLMAKEKNIVELNKLIGDPIFSNLDSIKVFESHRWVVTDSGDNLIALAESKDGVEIVKHKHKLIYGFQFHPEMFGNSTEGNEIFANFINIVQNKLI